MQTCGNRQQGLTGAGLADQRHQLDAVVHQDIQRKRLLTVAGEEAPDTFLGHLAHRHYAAVGRIVATDGGVGWIGAVHDCDEFIGAKLQGRLDPPLTIKTVNRFRRHLDATGYRS